MKLTGKILFDPENHTKKHDVQSSWKKYCMIQFPDDDFISYYLWFIKKRYNLILNAPLRKTHLTIVNDRETELSNWEKIKKKYNNKSITINVEDDSIRTNGEHWWFKIYDIDKISQIRKELNLKEPYYNFHITIGYANEKNIEHSRYIHRLIENNL